MTSPTLTESLDAIRTFDLAAGCTRWAPGARAMAMNAAMLDPIARRTYAMLAAESCMPLSVGERVRRPVLSTIRRRDHAQLVREAAARRRLEELREIREAMA